MVHSREMNNTKYVNRALRLLVEDKGKSESIALLWGTGISLSAAEKLARRKYRIKVGGFIYGKILPVIKPYMGEAS